jgi:hypothetical protein
MRRRRLLTPVAVATTALAIGYVVYAVARPHTRSFLLWHISSSPIQADLYTPTWLLGAAPSLLHTLAFAILLAIAVGGATRRRLAVCAAWGAFELAAEFAQLPGGPFRSGTFALTDVFAIIIGTAAAMRCVRHSPEDSSHAATTAFDPAALLYRRRTRSGYL